MTTVEQTRIVETTAGLKVRLDGTWGDTGT